MLIIFMAHVPTNLWAEYIPARYGWSDATEMFVFCSGFAAALAFGGTFIKAGFWYGSIRIIYRIWQIYAAHIAMFFFIAGIVAAGTMLLDTQDYTESLGISWFFENSLPGIVGLFSMTYVPNYFDILPMYIGALVLLPIIMALSRVHRFLAIGACVLLYCLNYGLGWGVPADLPRGLDREWFFNPMGWQLLFFTGFAFAMGWIKPPPFNRTLLTCAVVFVVVSIPVSRWAIAQNYETLREIRIAIWYFLDKTDFGIIRYVHFLALAYIALYIIRGRAQYLHAAWCRPIITVGQSSLPVFLLSMGLSQLAGMALDVLDRTPLTYALVNVTGLSIVILFAYWCKMLRQQPWRKIMAEREAGS
jgi:hypothetical protein